MKWLERKTAWTSPEIQNEVFNMAADRIVRKFAEESALRKFFSLIVDETSDCTQIEQLCFCLRTVTDDLEVEERFIGMHNLDRCDAESITNAIINILQKLSLPISNCRGQCYDGAAAMSGHKTGVASRIESMEPRAVRTHCHMHAVNLSVNDTVSSVPVLRDFLQLLQELITFLRNSPKRRVITRVTAESFGCSLTEVRPLCPTRFTVKFHAIDGILKQLLCLPDTLEAIEAQSTDNKVKSTASGFLTSLQKFNFYFGLVLCHWLFERTDRLNTSLQRSDLSAGEGVQLVEYSIGELCLLRNDEKFESLWKEARALSDSMEVRLYEYKIYY
jgi:hypothetical protein